MKEDYKQSHTKEEFVWKFKCREDFWDEIKDKVKKIEEEISEKQFFDENRLHLLELHFKIESLRMDNTLMY